MKILELNLLKNITLVSFGLYFIFNFYDRNISNIFLLATLLLCLINYKNLFSAIESNTKLVLYIILFSVYISILGFQHETPLSELDNYYRFLLLLPLLLITLSETRIIGLIFISAIAGIIHAYANDAFYGIHLYPDNVFRYEGTSSIAITYSIMCSTLFMVCLYYMFYKNNKSYHLILSSIIFLILFMITETRGPLIGIVIASIYLSYAIKNKEENSVNYKLPLVVLSIFLISLMTIPNPVGERLKLMADINLADPAEIESSSLRDRTYYLIFAIKEIEDNYIQGIGPQNVIIKMSQSFEQQGIKNIEAMDHVHSEFFDITLKFGILSLILLLFVYFLITKTKNEEHRVLLNILMIMLLSSQLTQSQFAHHQAITFFIALFYLLRPNSNFIK